MRCFARRCNAGQASCSIVSAPSTTLMRAACDSAMRAPVGVAISNLPIASGVLRYCSARRTTTANRRRPSMTSVAVAPPTPPCTWSRTSDGVSPYRASAPRSNASSTCIARLRSRARTHPPAPRTWATSARMVTSARRSGAFRSRARSPPGSGPPRSVPSTAPRDGARASAHRAGRPSSSPCHPRYHTSGGTTAT